MKKILFFSLFISLFVFAGLVAAKHFWRGETLSIDQSCSRWGNKTFEIKSFKDGDEGTRRSMVCSLLRNQKLFIGKDRSDIRKELGDYNGFYFSDMFPAYMIESAQIIGKDSWQIVFLLDKNEKVSEIIAHKNCCD